MICEPCREHQHRMCTGGVCACPKREMAHADVVLTLSADEAQRLIDLIEADVQKPNFDKRTTPVWRRLVERIRRLISENQEA